MLGIATSWTSSQLHYKLAFCCKVQTGAMGGRKASRRIRCQHPFCLHNVHEGKKGSFIFLNHLQLNALKAGWQPARSLGLITCSTSYLTSPVPYCLCKKSLTPLLVAVRLGEGFHCFASTNSSNNNMTRLWWWQRWKFLSLWAALHHLLLLLLHSELVGRTKMAGRAACCEAKLLSEGGMCLWELPSLFGFWLENAELEVNSLQSFPLFCLPFTFSSSHGPYKGCDLKWEAVCAINKQQLSLAGVWGHIQKEIAIDLGGTYIVFKCCVTARLDPAGDSAGDGFPLGPWGEHSAWWAAGFVYNGEDRNLSFILLLTFLPR